MKSRAEQLPIELWVTIFSYIEIHDIFQAFSNLNNHFDEVLASNHLSFFVQLKLEDNNYNSKLYRRNFHWSNSLLNRIICLQSSTIYQPGDLSQFLQSHSEKLIRLRSLILQSPIQEIPLICNAIENVYTVQYLSLTCVPTQKLLETILAAPNLRICRLKFWRPISTINCYSSTNSNVKVLHIKLLEDLHHSILNLLLSHMPRLKSLEIEEFDSIPLFNQQLFTLEYLQILKFIWNFRENTSNYGKDCHKIIPCLKYLYLTVYYFKFDELMNNNLIHFLQKILQKLKSITVFVLCRQLMKIIDNNIQKKIEDYCQQLLIQLNTQSNIIFEFKWTENNSFEHQIELFFVR